MKKSLKIGLGVMLVLLLVIGGSLFWAYNSLDHLVASAIRSYGSEMTGVPVKVGSVHIDLGKGSATIRDLSVGNPAGFKAKHALELHEITVAIDLDSLSKPVLVINNFTLADLDVNYETTKKGNNVDVIKANINNYMAQYSSNKEKPEAKAEKAGPEKKFILKKVDITGGKVVAESYFLAGKAVSAKLPDIHLRNIGQASRGATPGQIGKEIFGAIAKNSAKAVAKASAGSMLNQFKSSDSVDALKGLFK